VGATPFFLRPTTEREALMRRIMLMVTVALVMAAMMVAMVAPALAKEKVYRCDNFETGSSETANFSKKEAKEYEKAGVGTCEIRTLIP
jgi:hypothetical protein